MYVSSYLVWDNILLELATHQDTVELSIGEAQGGHVRVTLSCSQTEALAASLQEALFQLQTPKVYTGVTLKKSWRKPESAATETNLPGGQAALSPAA